MKKSLFLSTLIATAALALPAWAYTVDTDSKTITFTSEDTDTIATIWGDAYSGYTVIFNGVTTSGLGGGNNAYTCYADIVINAGTYGGGLTITNGWSGASYTFTGNISGAGDWTMSNSGVAEHYIFTGSMSGYSGTIDFSVGSSSATFNFGNGMELTGDLTNVSGTGAIIINGTLEYNYTASDSTPVVTIGNSSSDTESYPYDIRVTTLNFAGSVDYVVNATTIEGYLTSGTGGNTMTISTTGSVTFNSTTITHMGVLTVDEESTIVFAGTSSIAFSGNDSAYGMHVNGTLEVAENASFTISRTGAGNAYTSIANLKLDDGSTLALADTGGNSNSSIGTVTMNGGTATITASNSYEHVSIGALSGSGTLVLGYTVSDDRAMVYELTGTSTSSFSGTIDLTETNSSTTAARGVTLIISDQKVAAGAVIEMGTDNSSYGTLALGVNASTVEIAGLVSEASHNGSDIIYSGYVSTGTRLGNAGASLIDYASDANKENFTGVGTSRNTLVINTAEGTNYSFSGVVMDMLNLEKTGAGTQSITFQLSSGGTSGYYFDGSIAVNAGTLNLSGEAISSTGITVAADATLTIANSVSLAATTDVTEVSSTISGTLSITETGSLALSGSVEISSAISNSGTITIDSSTTSFVLDSLTKDTNGSNDYYVLITGNSGTVSADGITIDNFTLSEGSLEGTWSVWTDGLESGYLVIYGEAQTTAGKTDDNLIWAGTDTDYVWSIDSTNTVWQTASGDTGYYFTDGNNVTFGAEGANTIVAVEGEVTAGSTTINSAYTFNIDSDATLTTGALTYGEGGSLALTGSGTIVTGPGADSVFVINASDFTGTLEITSGRFDLVNSTVNESATLVFDASGEVDETTGVYDGSTSIHYGTTVGTESSPASYTLANDIKLQGEGGVILRSGNAYTTITLTGSVTGGTGTTLQLNGGGTATFSGTVSLDKYINYQGATIFTNATTLGALEIYQAESNAGDVTFTGSAAQATVTTLTVHATTGTGIATLTVSDGASLSVGTMAINDNFAITIDKAAMSITTSVTQTDGTSTSVTISNGGTLSLGSNVELNVAAMEIVLGTDTYTNGTYAIIGGTDSLIVSEAAIRITVDEALAELLGTDGTYTFDIYSGLSLDSDVFDIDDILSYTDNVSWDNGVLTVIVGSGAIPEPSMFGVIFGLGALGIVATRRRRRKAA